MAVKPTYEALENRVRELERKLAGRATIQDPRPRENLRDEKGPPKSAEKYRLMVENANEAILVAQDGVFVFSNPKAEALFGYSEKELGSRPLTEFVHEADRSMVGERHGGRLAGATSIPDIYDFRIIHKSGDIRWVNLKVALFSWEDRPATLCFMTDITKRRQAEEGFRENQNKYRTLFEAANDAIFVACAVTGVLQDANQQAEQLIGRRKHEIIGMHFTELHPQKQRSVALRNFEKDSELKGKSRYTDFVVQHADGQEIPVQISPSLIQIQGVPCVLGIFRDVSEQKKTEDTLRKHAGILSAVTEPVVYVNRNYIFEIVNDARAERVGMSKEDFIGRHVSEIHGQDHFERSLRGYMDRCFAGETVLFREWFSVPDGTEAFLDVSYYPVYDEKGAEIIGAAVYTRERTEQKKAEDALRRSEGRYRAIFQNEHVVMLVIDPDTGAIRDANPAAVAFYGWSYEELTGMNIKGINILTPAEVENELRAALQKNRGYFHFRHRLKDGTIRDVEVSSGPVEYDEKILLYSIVRDVTKRKRAENAFREREAFLGTLLNAIPTPIFYKDRNGRYLGVNDAFETFFGKSKDYLIGKTVFDVVPDRLAEIYHAKDNELFESGGEQRYESQVETARGELRDVIFSKSVYRNNEGAIAGIIGAALDITERKRAETALKNALVEKEILLREIHHRVKNNMQTIVGLLRMHARRIDNAQLTEIFNDCRDRIGAMSLIHEALYQSDDLAKIDFEGYLKKLCRNLAQAHDAQGKRIALTANAADVSLNMDQGIAVGMIIAELISNAFKHAFPDGETGTVSVHLDCPDGETARLIVSDTGEGLPADFDIRNPSSLGMRLVAGAVTRELGGSIDVETGDGARFIIRFNQ